MSRLAAFLLIAAAMLYLHPYYGIRHDSVLYLGQALLHSQPQEFGKDLFFAFGSQAEFTLFPQLIGIGLKHFGAANTFLVLTLVGQALFLLASWWLLGALLPDSRQRVFALLALVVMPSGYGSYGIFSYAEPFGTARTYAEPLVLFAIGSWLRQRYWLAAFASGMAMLIHPLQVIPAVLLGWLDLVRRDRRWLHLAWIGVVAALLVWLSSLRAEAWLSRYDAEWFNWIVERSRHVFLTYWPPADFGYLATDLFFVWLASATAPSGQVARLARLLLLATTAGFGASLIFADLLHSVLATGLQLWRVQWLLHWFAMALLPTILADVIKKDGWRSTRLAMLLSVAFAGSHWATSWDSNWQSAYAPSYAPSPLVVFVMVPVYFAWPHLRGRVRMSFLRLLDMTVASFLVLSLARALFLILDTWQAFDQSRYVLRPEHAYISLPLVAGALLLWAFTSWQAKPRWRVLFLCALASSFVLAADTWDRRTAWTLAIESARPSGSHFGVALAPGSVFWPDELVGPWLVLGRPSYYAPQQMSGALFNRGTAAEGHRREEAASVLATQLILCKVMTGLTGETSACMPDVAAVRDVCDSGRGNIRYVVLANRLDSKVVGEWTVMGRGLRGDKPVNYFLYDCMNLALPKQQQFLSGTK